MKTAADGNWLKPGTCAATFDVEKTCASLINDSQTAADLAIDSLSHICQLGPREGSVNILKHFNDHCGKFTRLVRDQSLALWHSILARNPVWHRSGWRSSASQQGKCCTDWKPSLTFGTSRQTHIVPPPGAHQPPHRYNARLTYKCAYNAPGNQGGYNAQTPVSRTKQPPLWSISLACSCTLHNAYIAHRRLCIFCITEYNRLVGNMHNVDVYWILKQEWL